MSTADFLSREVLPGALMTLWVLLALKSGNEHEADADLVVKIRRGDDRAFRALYNRYHVDLYRFLRRVGAPDDASEDILQDVFTGAWSARKGLDPSRSIRAYLYRACRNRAANYFRSQSRLTQALLDEPASPLPPHDETLDYVALRDRLERAVSALPERRRAVFELCFMSGLSYKEAADILEISTKTVENQMGFALKAIRENLSPYADRP